MAFAATFVALTLLVPAVVADSASAAGSRGQTRIASPGVDQVVGNGLVHVVLRSRASLGALRVSVDGRDVKRYFHRSAGAYRATLRLGHGLHFGVDELLVVTGAYAEVDRVAFVVARRAPGLLRLSNLRVGGNQAPVRVVARAAPDTTLRAWVNGHRDEGAFEPQGNSYVGRLGANDWVRPGRNRLQPRAT